MPGEIEGTDVVDSEEVRRAADEYLSPYKHDAQASVSENSLTHALAHALARLRVVLVGRPRPLAHEPPRLRQTWVNRPADSTRNRDAHRVSDSRVARGLANRLTTS